MYCEKCQKGFKFERRNFGVALSRLVNTLVSPPTCLEDCPASLLDADANRLDSHSFKIVSAAFWAQLSVVLAKVSGFAPTCFFPVDIIW